jgi:hypothetical protein
VTITDAQRPLLHAALRGIGLTKRPEKLTALSVLCAREITTSSALTKDEATKAINQMLEMPAWEAAEYEAEVERLRAGLYDPWAEVGAA